MTELEFLLRLLGYFGAGALLDILATIDLKAAQLDKAFKSAFVTFISTFVSYYIFNLILASPEFELELFFYALGGSVGTYYLIKHKWY